MSRRAINLADEHGVCCLVSFSIAVEDLGKTYNQEDMSQQLEVCEF